MPRTLTNEYSIPGVDIFLQGSIARTNRSVPKRDYTSAGNSTADRNRAWDVEIIIKKDKGGQLTNGRKQNNGPY